MSLESISADLDSLIAAANASTAANLKLVSDNMDVLTRYKEMLERGIVEEATDEKIKLQQPPWSGDKQALAAHKTWLSTVNQLAKSVDKVFGAPLEPLFPSSSPAVPGSSSSTSAAPFSSPESIVALNDTIALHLARIGAFAALETFVEESSLGKVDPALVAEYSQLSRILTQLDGGVYTLALEWVASGGKARLDSPLAFELRRDEFSRMLLFGPAQEVTEGSPTPSQMALTYAGTHFRRFMSPGPRQGVINSLITSTLYMPPTRLLATPYAHLYADYQPVPPNQSLAATRKLKALFSEAFIEAIGQPRDSPLAVVTDIGGGGAIAKILKVRSVMKDKKTEWSAVGELPVEIPIPSRYHYHSVFICPVSKEQATAANPAMLLPCGHVLAKESVIRLGRGSQSIKCPYCPVVSLIRSAVRVHF